MKLRYALLPLVALLSFASCAEEEEPCDPAKEQALAQREGELDQREADLLARERAIGMNTSSSGDNSNRTSGNSNAATDGATAGKATRSNNRYIGRARPAPTTNEQRVGYRKSTYFPGQYPEASERALTTTDLEHKSSWGKTVMLNEIYARHGLTFNQPDLRRHFNGESWYKGGKNNVDKTLTATEKQNIAFIKQNM